MPVKVLSLKGTYKRAAQFVPFRDDAFVLLYVGITPDAIKFVRFADFTANVNRIWIPSNLTCLNIIRHDSRVLRGA